MKQIIRSFVLAALGVGILGAAACGGSRSQGALVRSAGLELLASLDPSEGRIGENRIWLEVRDADANPVDGADVEVKVHMHAMGAMPAMGGLAGVTPEGNGVYRADFELKMGSTWMVEIRVRPLSGAMAEAVGSLTVGTPGVRLEAARGDRPAMAHSGSMEEASPDVRHPAEFSIDHARLQRVGVRVMTVERVPLEVRVRSVGRIVYDETRLQDVSLKIRGWVGELEANAEGISVTRGDVLFTVYSPDLYTAQEEYLQALRSQRAAQKTSVPRRSDALARAARRRLELWDIAATEIERIARTDAPIEYLPIRAPTSGFVIEKNLVEGSAVEPGQRLFRIAPLDRVWLEAEIYESELQLVSVGQPVRVTLPYIPGRSYEGTVSYIYPYLAGDSRTARVRVEHPNADLELRPEMYANVELRTDKGMRIAVPGSAILYAGERRFVFVDLGGGRFRPQRVELGIRSGERVEVLSGLEVGQRVVSSGTFFIASESRLRAALEQW